MLIWIWECAGPASASGAGDARDEGALPLHRKESHPNIRRAKGDEWTTACKPIQTSEKQKCRPGIRRQLNIAIFSLLQLILAIFSSLHLSSPSKLAAPAVLVTNISVFGRQDALRTPSPATFLPANLSTIAKPHTPENGGRQEYSPLARTKLDVDMDLHDRGHTSNALARPPGHAGNPRNSVQADAVLPSKPITSHKSFLETQRADFREHDAHVQDLAIRERAAYSPANRRFNARNATPGVHSGRDLPPHPYSSDVEHQHATNGRYGSRSNSFSGNPGQGPGNNGPESDDKIPAEVRETWSEQQEIHRNGSMKQ